MKTIVTLLLLFCSLNVLAKNPEIFRFRLVEDPGTLDWNYGEVSPDIMYQLMEGLFTTDENGKPVPALVRSYRWSKNKRTITFKLKNALLWSDGEKLCAKHFVDSWNRLKSKEFASPYAHYGNPLQKFRAKSCDTLILTLKRKSPELPAMLSHYVFFPIRLDVLEKHPKMFSDGKGLVVNGAFKVKSWQRDQKIILEANPQYRKKWRRIQQIEALIIPEDNTAITFFENAKIDWLRDVAKLLRKAWVDKEEFKTFPTLTAYYLGLNAKTAKVLKDRNVRLALSHVLERDELSVILGEEVRGVKTWLMPEMLKNDKVKMPKVNLAKAKKALKKQKDLKIYVYSKSSHKLLAEWLQAQWRKHLGVEIPIMILEEKVYWREIYEKKWPIFLSGVTAPYNHPRSFMQEFLTSSTANWTNWSSKKYDRYVNQEKFAASEQLLLNAGHILPLYSRGTVALVQKGWKAFHINPLGQTYLNQVYYEK